MLAYWNPLISLPVQNTGQGKPLHRIRAIFLVISGFLNCHLTVPFSLIVKKDSNMQNLSKCIRQLFFLATYSPLIQIGPSKLLINSVPSSCCCRDSYLHGCMCLCSWNGAGSSRGHFCFTPPLGRGKVVGIQGVTERRQEPVRKKQTWIRLPSLVNMKKTIFLMSREVVPEINHYPWATFL